MPECFVCNHPILEGQKKGRRDFATDALRKYHPDMDFRRPVHWNPADCLPTLAPSKGRNDYETEILRQVAVRERERASGLVKTFATHHSMDSLLRQKLQELAQQIGAGE